MNFRKDRPVESYFFLVFNTRKKLFEKSEDTELQIRCDGKSVV